MCHSWLHPLRPSGGSQASAPARKPERSRLTRTTRRNCHIRRQSHLGWPGGALAVGVAAVAMGLLLGACVGTRGPAGAPPAAGVTIHEAPAPSPVERYCAWFGDARRGVLYFGISPFWSALREADDPLADLERAGPQLVGRFDLEARAFLAPLSTGARAARAGTWDVLAHPNGRVYFTTYFEAAGWIEPESGASRLFETPGRGLNELALGPEGGILATRYDVEGAVVALDPDGRLLAEYPLEPPPGGQVWPKSVAYDAVREQIWVTTDLLLPDARGLGHDARVLDATNGRELRRIVDPEIQFVVFGRDGVGYLAEVEDSRLFVRVVPAAREAERREATRRILLDEQFAAGLDFVQELVALPQGGVLATRWSGIVHRVDATGRVRSRALPRSEGGGLYYTAVPADGRLCATLCADVEVVCATAP